MKSVLLAGVNAKYIHSNLAVYSLKAACRELSEHVELAEFTINHRTEEILREIYKRKPEVLLFSCYIWNIGYVEELIAECHKVMPKVPIWLGGPEVSYDAEEMLEKHPELTGILVGEGEETFPRLVNSYVNKEMAQLDRILRGELCDMSQLPFAYEGLEDFEHRIIYYESSRGCPFSCSYCLSSIDKSVRFRDLELVKKELQFFLDAKVHQVKFVDRTFNCDHHHAMEIWQFLKEQDKGITNFHFEISADLLNEEELELIASMRPGLIQLEIGVQSTNEATISEIHRTMKLERLKETVKRIQEAGNVHEHLDLIAGLPYEDYATFAKSFDEIYALKPNQLQLGFLKVLKGSYMYEHAADYEMVYHSDAPYEVLKTKWLSYEEVVKIKQVEEMLETYYNSGQFEVTMKLLELLFESPFSMFQELGTFYEKAGYFAMSHSRIRRCEILLEFVKDRFPEQSDVHKMLEESLTFDLYYRENCKSRPSWAPPLSAFKAETKAYCKCGSLSHVEPFHYIFPTKKERSIKALPVREESWQYVLFDYANRDPLDHQAAVRVVEKI